MGEDKSSNLAERIEKLIVDGNKEIVQKIDALVDQKINRAKQEILLEVRAGDDQLGKKIDTVHSSLKQEIVVTAYAVKDDVKEVGKKLDAHLRVAA